MGSAKAWVASLGSAVTGVLTTYTDIPPELATTIGVLITGLFTWLVPNASS